MKVTWRQPRRGEPIQSQLHQNIFNPQKEERKQIFQATMMLSLLEWMMAEFGIYRRKKKWVLKPSVYSLMLGRNSNIFHSWRHPGESIVTVGMKNRHSFCYFFPSPALFSVHDWEIHSIQLVFRPLPADTQSERVQQQKYWILVEIKLSCF